MHEESLLGKRLDEAVSFWQSKNLISDAAWSVEGMTGDPWRVSLRLTTGKEWLPRLADMMDTLGFRHALTIESRQSTRDEYEVTAIFYRRQRWHRSTK